MLIGYKKCKNIDIVLGISIRNKRLITECKVAHYRNYRTASTMPSSFISCNIDLTSHLQLHFGQYFSFHIGRIYFVWCPFKPLRCILGALLFIITNLTHGHGIKIRHGVSTKCDTDNTQLYIKLSTMDIIRSKSRLINCTCAIQNLNTSMCLKLNASKTALIYFYHNLPATFNSSCPPQSQFNNVSLITRSSPLFSSLSHP